MFYIFSSCSGLTSVTFGNSVTSIGDYAFYNCSGLASISIPNSVTSIGPKAFYGTSWFENQPNGLVYAGKLAYKYKGEMSQNTSIVLKEGTLGIVENAFEGCSGLTSITIPSSVTTIVRYAFKGCSGLTTVTIPNSVTSIGDAAFGNCSGLTSIAVENGNAKYDSRNNCNAIIETSTNTLVVGCMNTVIPNSVTKIGSSAFSGCSGLISVIIPKSVTGIGDYAFSGSSGLTSVVVNMSIPPSIKSYTFTNHANATLYVPKNSKATYQARAFWNSFKAIKEFPDPDVNQDGTVNVVDVVDIARFVVGTPRNAFVEFLADLNNSGGVNVADAVVLVNEIAGDTQFARQLRAPEQTGSDVLTLCSVDDTRLSFRLDGSERYAAFQFDLWLPSDVDVMQLSLNNERCQNHQLLYNKVGDGHYRVVALSASGSAFNGTSGELLGLTFDGFATDEVGIDNIHFVTTNGTDVPFDALGVTVSSEVTAIRSAENSSEGAQPAYNLNGQRLESPRKGLNIIGGKKIVVK